MYSAMQRRHTSLESPSTAPSSRPTSTSSVGSSCGRPHRERARSSDSSTTSASPHGGSPFERSRRRRSPIISFRNVLKENLVIPSDISNSPSGTHLEKVRKKSRNHDLPKCVPEGLFEIYTRNLSLLRPIAKFNNFGPSRTHNCTGLT